MILLLEADTDTNDEEVKAEAEEVPSDDYDEKL